MDMVMQSTPNALVPGVGPDAPTVVHDNGSKESLCLYALDVIPYALFKTLPMDGVLHGILRYLSAEHDVLPPDTDDLLGAFDSVLGEINQNKALAVLEVGRVLAEGERKYGGDQNWRGIEVRQHLRHALAHYLSHLAGDRQEGPIGHLTRTACRIAFAIEVAAQPTEGL